MSTQPLLASDEAPPWEAFEAEGDRPVVVVCDHAGRTVPRALGTLGLPEARLGEHIAWDIGAGGVARRLAERLGASLVMGRYSRLVVDLNRDLEDSTAFPAISDGVLIPANLGLSVEEKAERARVFFKPYHEAVRRAIQGRSRESLRPVLIAVHSFTPRLHRILRPWHVGILWDKDPRLPLPLMRALGGRGFTVGNNEPYSGRHPADYTVDHHAEPLGLAHVGIELRQDLVGHAEGQAKWAARLADALERVLDDEALYRARESLPGRLS
jgi:predicted N-formylglutamate amidohydrolase